MCIEFGRVHLRPWVRGISPVVGVAAAAIAAIAAFRRQQCSAVARFCRQSLFWLSHRRRVLCTVDIYRIFWKLKVPNFNFTHLILVKSIRFLNSVLLVCLKTQYRSVLIMNLIWVPTYFINSSNLINIFCVICILFKNSPMCVADVCSMPATSDARTRC